jgi:hypothetical protein
MMRHQPREGIVNQDVNPLELIANQVGMSRFDVAQMLDATPGIVDAWLSGTMEPGPRSRQKLDELLLVFEGLFEKMTPTAARDWLTSPSAGLDYYEPLDLLRRGDLQSVMRVIDALPRSIRMDRYLSSVSS